MRKSATFLFLTVLVYMAAWSAHALEPLDCPTVIATSYSASDAGVEVLFVSTVSDSRWLSNESELADGLRLTHESSGDVVDFALSERGRSNPGSVWWYTLSSDVPSLAEGRWTSSALQGMAVDVRHASPPDGRTDAEAQLRFPVVSNPMITPEQTGWARISTRVSVTVPEPWADVLGEGALLRTRVVVDPVDPDDPLSGGSHVQEGVALTSGGPDNTLVAVLFGDATAVCSGASLPDWAGGERMVGWLSPASDEAHATALRFTLDLGEANATLDGPHGGDDDTRGDGEGGVDAPGHDGPDEDRGNSEATAPGNGMPANGERAASGCAVSGPAGATSAGGFWLALLAGLMLFRRRAG